MAKTTIVVSALLLFPFLINAGSDPITILSPSNGFVVTKEQHVLTVSGAIEKGFWENKVLRSKGVLTFSVFAADKQTSENIEVVPVKNQKGKVIGYNFSATVDVDSLRGATELSLAVSVEAKSSAGKVLASTEASGTLESDPAASLRVWLSATTPPSALYNRGSIAERFTVIIFTANDQESIKINQLMLTRNGGIDSDLFSISLYDGATRIGVAALFADGKTTITDLNLVIPKSSSKLITIRADVDLFANTYSIENGISIGIASAADVQAIGNDTGSPVEISGSLPAVGNPMGIQ